MRKRVTGCQERSGRLPDGWKGLYYVTTNNHETYMRKGVGWVGVGCSLFQDMCSKYKIQNYAQPSLACSR